MKHLTTVCRLGHVVKSISPEAPAVLKIRWMAVRSHALGATAHYAGQWEACCGRNHARPKLAPTCYQFRLSHISHSTAFLFSLSGCQHKMFRSMQVAIHTYP